MVTAAHSSYIWLLTPAPSLPPSAGGPVSSVIVLSRPRADLPSSSIRAGRVDVGCLYDVGMPSSEDSILVMCLKAKRCLRGQAITLLKIASDSQDRVVPIGILRSLRIILVGPRGLSDLRASRSDLSHPQHGDRWRPKRREEQHSNARCDSRQHH